MKQLVLMKKVIATIAAAGLAVSALGQGRWTLLTQAVAGEHHYSVLVDSSGPRPQAQYVKTWVLYKYADAQTDQYTGKPFLGTAELMYFNCRERTLTTKQQVLYTDPDKGDTLRNVSVQEQQLQWNEPVPGAVGELLLNYACRK
jgi:hypothetical protein